LQAKLLEKALTGYAPDDAKAAKPKGSKVAPPPKDAPPPEERPPPGLDLVVRLDVSDETARGRALGRRLDPATVSDGYIYLYVYLSIYLFISIYLFGTRPRGAAGRVG